MKVSTIFLQGVIVLVGFCVLTFLLWEPHFEGRNAEATWFEIYFKDPFLAYVYLGSVPFFVALSRVFKFLGLVREGRAFSETALHEWKIVRRCAFITAGAIVGALIYLRIVGFLLKDDVAGAISLGTITAFLSLIGAAVATVWQNIIQSGIALSEHQK